jgi:hypothetical protein
MTSRTQSLGSPRTEQLVRLAQAKISPTNLPPLPELRRYAAIAAAAEAWAIRRRQWIAGELAAEAKEYGIDPNSDPEVLQRAQCEARKSASQIDPKVCNVLRALGKLEDAYMQLTHLPSSLQRCFPLQALRVLEKELSKFRAELLGICRRPQSDPGGLTRSQMCFLSWRHCIRHRGQWKAMYELARVWKLTATSDERHLQRMVLRLRNELRKKHPGLPLLEAAGTETGIRNQRYLLEMPSEDRAFFE